ncbi:uncharacterized protein [Haliotis asinina]|uniref:uncharacterized protein n=1 Tax=Haliotis asinina TaxID=109174 RepID=UPI003531EF4B
MLGYLLTVICWLYCATVGVECEPLSGPVLKIGRCRARCLDKLLNETVSGDECLTTPDCHMCWDFCDNLFTKYRLYGVVCNMDKLCTRGCEIACDFRHKPPAPSKNQRWSFSTGDIDTKRNSRVTDIQWKPPKPPTSSKSRKSLVYIIMVRRKGSKDTWKQLKQVASHAVSLETDTIPDPPEFQLLAVSNRGIVARSKKLSPESFVKETYAFPKGHLVDGQSATYTPDISPMNITIDMKMVAGKLQTSLDWNHPSAEVLPCAKNNEPCFYEMNWFLTDCAAYPRAPACETLPYHTAETTHFFYHEKPNFRIPDIELNSLYDVLISIRDAHGEAVEGKTSFKTPLCLKMSIDRTTCNDDLDVFGQNNPENVPANLSLAVSTVYPETVSSTDIEELKLKINESPQMTFNPSTGMMEVNVTWTSVLNQSVFEKYQVFWYTDDDQYNPHPGQNETVQTHMILELETNRLYTIDVTAYYTDDYSEPGSITDAIQLLTQRNLSSSTVIAQPIKQPHKQDLSTLSGVIVGVVVATILIIVGFVVLFYKKRKSFKDIIITKTFVTKSNSYKSNVGAGKSNYSNQLMVISDEWELDPKQLKFSTQLGQGAFGKVVTGYYCDQKVAIKLIKEGAPLSYKEDLVAEINLMKRVGSHPNIVAMIGACTLNEPIALIMEFIPHGNLQNFMKKCRLEGDLRKRSDGASEIAYSMVDDSGGIENYFITPTDMLSFARQVAMAMEYLTDRRYVHRDLAARNVLLGPNKVVKLCDFGLSRDIYNDNQYKKLTNGKLPLKWMAIESLRDRVFTTQSDVWSFGILLWEIVTMGASPYPHIALSDLYYVLVNGYRMEKTSNCSDELYALMLQCWAANPADRPCFTQLRMMLEELMEEDRDYLVLENINVPLNTSENSSSSSSVDDMSTQPSGTSSGALVVAMPKESLRVDVCIHGKSTDRLLRKSESDSSP